MLYQVPYTIARMRRSDKWYDGFRLSTTVPRGSPIQTSHESTQSPQKRIPHYRLRLPVRHIGFFDLSLPEFLTVIILWAAGLGVAAWCQSAFLTHTSRSTLIIMALMSLTAALGLKAGGVGTWIVKGYTAINFLHRWTGRLVWFLATLHVVAYLVVFQKAGSELHIPDGYRVMLITELLSHEARDEQARKLSGCYGLWRTVFNGITFHWVHQEEMVVGIQIRTPCQSLPVGVSSSMLTGDFHSWASFWF